MNLLKKTAGLIGAVWASLIFIITMLLMLPPILLTGMLSEPQRSHSFYHISRFWMLLFFPLTGVRRIFTGKENFKKGATYIVVCNHRSFMDIPLTSPGIPGTNKTIAKIELTKVPIFGIFYKRGSVLVNRKDPSSRKNSFMKMKEVLSGGMHMCIYPEGTRNRTDKPLQPFYDGAFRLAVDTGVSILPTVIFNTAKVMPANSGFYFLPHPVEMHFLPSISPEGLTADELKEKVYEVMEARIELRDKG